MHLRLIDGYGPDEDEFPRSPGLPAADRPCRPGLALISLHVPVDRETADRIETLAASAGVTTSLWAATAIEATRAVDLMEEALRRDADAIVATLDRVAKGSLAHSSPKRNSELWAYATGLRNVRPRPRRSTCNRGTVSLSIPTHTHLAWSLASEDAGENIESWAARKLSQTRVAPIAWEAAAAGAGASLGEWISVQAARAASRRSSSAQILPCG